MDLKKLPFIVLKVLITALCTGLLVFACSFPDSRYIPSFEPRHEYEEFCSLDELLSSLDFDFRPPEGAFPYDSARYFYIPDMKAAEAVYVKDEDWIEFVKMDGFVIDQTEEYEGGFLSFMMRAIGPHEDFQVFFTEPRTMPLFEDNAALYLTGADRFRIDKSILQIDCVSFRETERLPDQELMFNVFFWDDDYHDTYIFSTKYQTLEEMMNWFFYMESNKEQNG